MSIEYDQYLVTHKENVKRAYQWLRDNLPELSLKAFNMEWLIDNHDFSKTRLNEYEAYDVYFYGNNKSYEVVQNFNKAWLEHIHNNPHHWQHWVLINDDPDESEILIEMPANYAIEMICDWWSFCWRTGDLMGIFTWYDERKDYMKLHRNTRDFVEIVLSRMKEKLNGEAV